MMLISHFIENPPTLEIKTRNNFTNIGFVFDTKYAGELYFWLISLVVKQKYICRTSMGFPKPWIIFGHVTRHVTHSSHILPFLKLIWRSTWLLAMWRFTSFHLHSAISFLELLGALSLYSLKF